MLTKRQKQILDFVKEFVSENEYSPSLEEIAEHLGVSSVATVHEHLENLRAKGYLNKNEHQARSIELDRAPKPGFALIPLMGMIAAGSPIEAVVEPETIEVAKTMLAPTGKHYALKVTGDSMIEEGILDGDTVIVRDQENIENGETAVAYLPETNEATLKKIYKEKARVRLQPANARLKPFYAKKVTIQGKVVGILRKLN